MKAIIGGVAGALALGGALLLANTRSASTAAPASYQTPALSAPAQPQSLAQPGLVPNEVGNGLVMAGSLAPNTLVMPVQYPVQYPVAAPQQQVVERVVYVDRPVTRTVVRTANRTTRAPVRYTVARKQPRTWKKSALIIGGGAAGGAGLGAILGGGSGAKKGAVVGGIGGLVYDLATRNKQ